MRFDQSMINHIRNPSDFNGFKIFRKKNYAESTGEHTIDIEIKM